MKDISKEATSAREATGITWLQKRWKFFCCQFPCVLRNACHFLQSNFIFNFGKQNILSLHMRKKKSKKKREKKNQTKLHMKQTRIKSGIPAVFEKNSGFGWCRAVILNILCKEVTKKWKHVCTSLFPLWLTLSSPTLCRREYSWVGNDKRHLPFAFQTKVSSPSMMICCTTPARTKSNWIDLSREWLSKG